MIIGNSGFQFLEAFHEIFLGRKIICVKWYHKETKQGDIISNGMKILLKKGKQGVITQLYSLFVQTCKAPISPYIQTVHKNPFKVFEDIPITHPPI